MIATGEDLLGIFKDKAEVHGKFFFQRPDDVKNANGLLAFYLKTYSEEMLINAIDIYFSKEKDSAVTLGTFVQHMTDINAKLVREQESQEKFQKLLRETRERMEDLG